MYVQEEVHVELFVVLATTSKLIFIQPLPNSKFKRKLVDDASNASRLYDGAAATQHVRMVSSATQPKG